MKQTLWFTPALGLLLLGAAGCGNKTADAADAGDDKAALAAAAKVLAQPVARIAAFQPHLRGPDGKDPYAPKNRNDLLKAGAYVSTEIRFAATSARQKMEISPVTSDVSNALAEVSKACTDAQESTGFEQCDKAVQALDAALAKAGAAAGPTVKFPRVSAEFVTEEAKKGIAPFLKALGPGPAEQAYLAKRSDPKAAFADVDGACQAAAEEAGATSTGFERAEEPLRLVAVTHKLGMESQCHTLEATEPMRKDLGDCRKKPKSADCKVVCAKVRARIDEGLPAATFLTMVQDVDSICGK